MNERGLKVVRFFDTRQAGKSEHFHPLLGQYVGDYYAHTIINEIEGGLNLSMGVPSWQIDGATMFEVSQWTLHHENVDHMEDGQ